MQARHALLVAAVAVFVAVAGGCGSDERPFRIGVLVDCQGALRGYGDGQLSGAERISSERARATA